MHDGGKLGELTLARGSEGEVGSHLQTHEGHLLSAKSRVDSPEEEKGQDARKGQLIRKVRRSEGVQTVFLWVGLGVSNSFVVAENSVFQTVQAFVGQRASRSVNSLYTQDL